MPTLKQKLLDDSCKWYAVAFGQYLRRVRENEEAKGVSEILKGTTLSEDTWLDIEAAKTRPQLKTLRAVATALGQISPAALQEHFERSQEFKAAAPKDRQGGNEPPRGIWLASGHKWRAIEAYVSNYLEKKSAVVIAHSTNSCADLLISLMTGGYSIEVHIQDKDYAEDKTYRSQICQTPDTLRTDWETYGAENGCKLVLSDNGPPVSLRGVRFADDFLAVSWYTRQRKRGNQDRSNKDGIFDLAADSWPFVCVTCGAEDWGPLNKMFESALRDLREHQRVVLELPRKSAQLHVPRRRRKR